MKLLSKLFALIKKDFILLSRSKISMIILLLAPLLVVLLVGFAFNSSSFAGINIASYSINNNSLGQNILNGFSDKGYEISYLDSKESCINSVKHGKSQICIVFPDDLSLTGSSNNIVLHVDNSRMNLAYNLIHEINSQVGLQASELGIAMANDLITALKSAKDSLPNRKIEVSSLIIESSSIKQSSEAIDKTAFHSILVSLNNSRDMLDEINGSEINSIKSELDDIIVSLGNFNIALSGGLTDITTKSDNLMNVLSSISNNIDVLIQNMNKATVLEAQKIVSPLSTQIESIDAKNSSSDYLLPTLLAVLILFSGVLLSSTLVLKERKTKAFFRNFITPTSDFTFIIGTYLTCIIISLIQFILVLLGLILIAKMPLFNVLGYIGLLLFISITVFIFIGMCIGYLFKSEESTILASVSFCAILMFFSNTILPIESIVGFLRSVALFNPLVIANNALKKIILFNMNISLIQYEIYLLVIGIIIFCVLTYLARKITRRMM